MLWEKRDQRETNSRRGFFFSQPPKGILVGKNETWSSEDRKSSPPKNGVRNSQEWSVNSSGVILKERLSPDTESEA